jgi:hypothetical protein
MELDLPFPYSCMLRDAKTAANYLEGIPEISPPV